MQRIRSSGVLLHPVSLPGPGGIGSFGSEARRFVDFLAHARQSLWQVLPLGPTAYGNSPYSCYSAFAGNPLLIDLHSLVGEGDLLASELDNRAGGERIDYPAVEAYKNDLLAKAAERFHAGADPERKREFWHFCDNTPWLHDFALFMAAKEHFHGKSWNRWPEDLSRRSREGYEKYSVKLGPAIGVVKYVQWQFRRQWDGLKEYANGKGVRIVGDMPIFVAFDSADVWANPQLFHLDEKGSPLVVAGVPPDYFSKTGQLWGNPLYNWRRMAEDGHGWWIARMRNDLSLYDLVRIDHFRGFEACWEVPKGQKTAVKGRWTPGPGERLFRDMIAALGPLPIIAEDLGVITPEVEALRDNFAFPGMKILQFAFDSGAGNPYLPHNHLPNSVVYTGTHDNDTTLGWWQARSEKEKKRILTYLRASGDEPVWDLIRAAFASVADYAIVPAQDLLELDSTGRMNVPGVAGGNWGWRFASGALTEEIGLRLLELSELYGRNSRK